VAPRPHRLRTGPERRGLPARVLRLVVGLAACAAIAHAPGRAFAQGASAEVPSSEEISYQLEQKYDAGGQRALAPAQAAYRDAHAMLASGNQAEAIRLLDAASDFDPEFPDAHFTLARVLLLRDPGRAVGELNEAFRILLTSYPWQRYLLANTLTALLVVWIVSLLLALVGIALRHLPHMVHITRELLSPKSNAGVQAAATAIPLTPVLWGLGAVPTVTIYTGLLSFRFSKREALLAALFLASVLLVVGGLDYVAPWVGAPTLDEPSLLVNRAVSSGYDPDLASALLAWQSRDPSQALFPFALGTMARRSGDLDLSERELTQAAVVQPRTGWILNNLGNVYFAREDYPRARETYEAAAAADPGAVEPHYNLAQVYTKQLMFAEASREQSRASAIAFDRVRDFSKISAPQLNRTVMDAAPPTKSLWALAQHAAPVVGSAALAGNRFLRWLTSLAPAAPFALVFLPAVFLLFAGLGQALGRGLATLHCSNCQKIVCRRCVRRMQQRAFCNECFQSVKDLKSTEFTRLLLTKRDRSATRRRTVGHAALTLILPGAGQMLRGAALSGFFAILVMTTAAVLLVSNGAILPSLDVLPFGVSDWTKRIPLFLLFVLTYAITVARYFANTTADVQGLATTTRPTARPGDEARVRENRRS
jgi:tetratricopeptide (TPR) repeat protein